MARYHQHKQKKTFTENVKEIVVLLLIVFLVRTFGFGLYQVPTGSMETTMLVGERFFADKFTILFSKPKRGDIISFNDPVYEYSKNPVMRLFQDYVWGPSNWTKRVIGIPGDVLRGAIVDGKPVVYLNDKILHEPYLNKLPLVCLLTEDKDILIAKAEREARTLVAKGRLAANDVESYIQYEIIRHWMWRPYDDRFSYENQPYYRMDPKKILFVNPEMPVSIPGIAVSPAGLLMQKPQVPLPSEGSSMERKGDSYWNGTDEFLIKLGKDEYWLMGDNRRGSRDCRFFGPVAGRLIHGKILLRIWSIDSNESWWILDLLKHPIDFWTRMRWSRFFQCVH